MCVTVNLHLFIEFQSRTEKEKVVEIELLSLRSVSNILKHSVFDEYYYQNLGRLEFALTLSDQNLGCLEFALTPSDDDSIIVQCF